MNPLLDRDEARAVDVAAVRQFSLSSAVLMENAGRGATERIAQRYRDRLARVVLVGGVGQNGGDAWVVARHLHLLGVSPRAFLVGDEAKVRGDAATNWHALRAMDPDAGVVCSAGPNDSLGDALSEATLIVDGLFGTGLDRPITGGYAEVVHALNASPAPCVALDLPSGVNADTGQELGVAVYADATVTFAGIKRGLVQFPGAARAGETTVASIGVPVLASDACLLEPSDLARWISPRPADAHKGRAGHIAIVAGSPGRTGAAWLAGRGAMRAGAGLVTLVTGSEAQRALDQKVIEMMTMAVDSPERAFDAVADKRAVVVGPGIGLDASGRELSLALSKDCPVPAVLDADALTAIADEGVEQLASAVAPRVLTPHPGEAARLLGCSTSDVQADRHRAARELSERANQVVVLKGAGTVIAAPSPVRLPGAPWACRGWVCGSANPALAAAGTGDVLAGIMGALLGPLDTAEAACCAVMLHTLAGARASQDHASADRGIFASEVADAIPQVIARVCSTRP